MSSAESFLAKEMKKLFKKNNYNGVIWLVFSDTEVKDIDYEFSNIINEIRTMDSQTLKKEMRNLKTKPIKIDEKRIFEKFFIKTWLKENNFFLLKYRNRIIELNHDEIVVAIGIIMNPISLK